MKINAHYRQLEESYLFSTIAQKAAAYQQEHPQARLIRMGIGGRDPASQPACD